MLQNRLEDWYERVGKKIMYFILVLLAIFVFFKYVFGLTAPFVVAWLFGSLLNPVVTWLNRRFKCHRALGTLLAMMTVLSAVITLLTLIIRQLCIQFIEFSESFPTYKAHIEEATRIVLEGIDSLLAALNLPSAIESIDNMMSQILDTVGSVLTNMVGMVTKVPNGFIFLLIVLIATFFMTKDYYMIAEFIKAQLPHHLVDKVVVVKKGLKGALGGYIRTQLILMCFTFSICLVGLFLLGRPYAFLAALGIAIFDALPLFGSGAILIPWGIYHLILGHYPLGVGLLCVYGTVIVMRQIMEPKVLASQIGVYPLVTLIALYIGLRTLGVIGMIIGPILVVTFQTLQRVGAIPPFKEVPEHKK